MTAASTICAFCGKNPPIKNSHILPRWTIRRSLDASVTGKLRPTDNINQRVQDAEKCELLCPDCEKRFNTFETAVAKLFDAGSITHGASYDADFVRFLVSIVWRVGTVRAKELQRKQPRFTAPLANALRIWLDYLQGKSDDIEAYPVGFVILDVGLARKVHETMQDDAFNGKGAPPVINRYFANWLECEVAVYEQYGFAIVWAKTGYWLIIGAIAVPDKTDFASVTLSPLGGTLPTAGHPVLPVVLATLGHQSWEYQKAASQISPTQRKKIRDDFKTNAGKVAGS